MAYRNRNPTGRPLNVVGTLLAWPPSCSCPAKLGRDRSRQLTSANADLTKPKAIVSLGQASCRELPVSLSYPNFLALLFADFVPFCLQSSGSVVNINTGDGEMTNYNMSGPGKYIHVHCVKAIFGPSKEPHENRFDRSLP